jgi:hypothetical protein
MRAPTTTSQKVAGLVGLVLLAAGLLGFAGNDGFATGDELDRGSFLGLDVNGWHNLVHAGSGLLLLIGATSRRRARGAWRLLLLAYVVVLVAGLIDQVGTPSGPGDDVFGVLPVNGPDHLLHAALVLLAIWGARAAKERRGHLECRTVEVPPADGPLVVGPGSGHVGGPRRNAPRIDARLPAKPRR